MDINVIDRMATGGNSILHKSTIISKVVMVLITLILVIITKDIKILSFTGLLILILHWIAKTPPKFLLHVIIYPLFFSWVFSLTVLVRSPIMALVIVLKAVNAAIVLTLLITTTTYVEIFGFLGNFLPAILVDILFATYRSFFIIARKLNNFITIIKLRVGLTPLNILINGKNVAAALAVVFIDSLSMAERMYQIYLIRGYNGRIQMDSPIWQFKLFDLIPYFAGIILIFMVII